MCALRRTATPRDSATEPAITVVHDVVELKSRTLLIGAAQLVGRQSVARQSALGVRAEKPPIASPYRFMMAGRPYAGVTGAGPSRRVAGPGSNARVLPATPLGWSVDPPGIRADGARPKGVRTGGSIATFRRRRASADGPASLPALSSARHPNGDGAQMPVLLAEWHRRSRRRGARTASGADPR
jgi:hypothetical protein